MPAASFGDGAARPARFALDWRARAAAIFLALALGAFLAYQALGTGRELPASGGVHAVPQHGLLSLPAAARGPLSAALGEDAAAYRVRPDVGGYRAASPAQGLAIGFTSSGARVSAGASRIALALREVSYGSRHVAVRPVAPTARGSRVVYSHAGLSEWYANGPLGLEQGFTLARAPAGAPHVPLTLSIALSANARASLAAGAQSVTFTRAGKAVLRYTGLAATDARGHRLHSWLQLQGGQLLVHVATAGARYPLRIDPFVQSELTASDGAAEDFLGYAVAVSGETIAVGAPHRDGEQGAVYVFQEPGSGWANATQTAELTASDGAAGDFFGLAVAVSGETIAVGAPGHSVGSHKHQGAVYVFQEPGTGWANATQTAELTASGGEELNELGYSVSASGETVVAGAPFVQLGSHKKQGAVYVFEEPGSGWANGTQTAELTASDGGESDKLGYSVATSGSTVVAGAPDHEVGSNSKQGAVYVFERPGSGWTNATQTAELTASDGVEANELGLSVAVSGETIVAGAPYRKVGLNLRQGAAYVFEEPGSGWVNATQTAELTASDGTAGNLFGYSVAVSGATVVAGAYHYQVGANDEQGAVYVFDEPGSGWANGTETAELIAADGAPGDDLGYSVAVSGTTVVSAAQAHKVGPNPKQGAAYVFSTAEHEAPVVETAGAASLTPTSERVQAVVNPNGANVSECKFEWGTTVSYGSSVACSALPGSGEIPVGVSAPISGLTPHTIYHFRISATNAYGTTEGSDQTFKTSSEGPPEPKGEFGRCVKVEPEIVGRRKVYHGGYKVANCLGASEAHNGKYEWEPGALKAAFKLKLVSPPVTLQTTVRSSDVICSLVEGKGEYTGLKTIGATKLTFTSCEVSGTHEKCKSPGAAEGEIESALLEGELGVITHGATSSADQLGLDMYPTGRTGPLAEFSCGITEPVAVSVQGSVIAAVKANKMIATPTLKFKATSNKQIPEAFAGEGDDVLEASFNSAPFEQIGLKCDMAQENEEKLEINSAV